MKTISLRVSTEFDRQLRIQAAHLDQNRSEFIRTVLAKKMAGDGNPAKVHTGRKRQAGLITRENLIEPGPLPVDTSARILGTLSAAPHNEGRS